jgi:hypothetical protein
MLDAMLQYFLTGEQPDMGDVMANAFFMQIASQMDRDAEAWEAKCAKNRENVTRIKRTQANANDGNQSPANANDGNQSPANAVNNNSNNNNNSNRNRNNNDDNDEDVNIILASSPITKEDMLRKYRLTEEQLRHYGELFNEENKGKKYNANDSPMKHFINWLAKRVKKDKENYDNNRPSYEQRANEASELVAELLAKCDEVRNEGGVPIDF